MPESTWVILVAWLSVVGDVTPPPGWEARYEFTQAVRSIAIREEWIGDHEETPCLADVRVLRDSCRELPHTWCIERLPAESWLDEQRAFGRAHREWLGDQIAMESPGARLWYLEDWMEDAQLLERIYYEASYARCDVRQRCSMLDVRGRLGRLRDMIGTEALERGTLPHIVPVWRFRRQK